MTSRSVSFQADPSVRVYSKLRLLQLVREPRLELRAHAVRRLAGGHRVSLGPSRDARREARGPRRSRRAGAGRARASRSPPSRPSSRRSSAPSGISAAGLPAREELAPVVDRDHARLHLLLERLHRLEERLRRVERRGREDVVHLVVEPFDPARVLVDHRVVRELRVLEAPELAASAPSRTTGRKRLKPALPSAGSIAKRKLPRQKRLRATVPSGWPSTASRTPPASAGLRRCAGRRRGRDRRGPRRSSPGAACPPRARPGSSRVSSSEASVRPAPDCTASARVVRKSSPRRFALLSHGPPRARCGSAQGGSGCGLPSTSAGTGRCSSRSPCTSGAVPFSPREHRDQPNGRPSLNAKYARRKYGRSAQSGRMTMPCSSSAAPA